MTDKLVATLDKAGVRNISTDLWGIFFEDISYSADGGLASDLVQNGAFEYNRADRGDWSNYTAWRKIVPEGSFAAFAVRTENPVAVENPHYAVAEIGQAPASLENIGFDGMVFRAGETYEFSVWVRAHGGEPLPISVSLIGDNGETLAETTVAAQPGAWNRQRAELAIPADAAAATGSDAKPVVAHQGMLRLTFTQSGTIDLDFVTLEPASTYKGLEHFRPDLVKALADLHPRFMRFPGGCITHGLGMDNMYHWDRTIGPVEHRPHNFNTWGYHQSFRIGYYEYLRLCETIGAKPLPVLPAGVSCQNTSQGPVPVAQEDMPAYIDEVLGLIEFCNGDADTEWGAKRAAMGHPEPFHLEYLGIGNEDFIDDVFTNRFQQIFDAVRAAHPEITVVGTVGPAPSGRDYERGWAYAREAGVPVVDEHSYQAPSWWFHNLDHYDDTDRQGPKVYLGEYGSWGTGLLNGLSEAAFMSRMELNGDAVVMASYAPLFCKNGHDSWNPNLIYFDNEHVYHPYSYWVQRMYATTTADTAWPVAVDGPTTFRRELPTTIGLKITGGAHADFSEVYVEGPNGEHVELPDVQYRGSAVTLPLDLTGDSYTLHAKVTYLDGMWGVQVNTGDVDGRDYNRLSLGRSFGVEVIRDNGGYALAGTEGTLEAVLPGTVWDVRYEVSERGEHAVLFIDGKQVLDGREVPEEPRRTVSVARDAVAGKTYVRVVNALPEAADVDLAQVFSGLGLDAAAQSAAVATVLEGADPYAGAKGEESPTAPVDRPAALAAGVYHAPAWSFTTITL